MAKSIVSLAVGMALAEGKLVRWTTLLPNTSQSLPASLYGETSIRNLLRMASGVRFNETYDQNDDLQPILDRTLLASK